MKSSLIPLLLLIFAAKNVSAWDNDELEIFDLVEEVNQNFYEYLELKNDASTAEIRKAYRKLSLVLHPDKNDAEDASLKFRWLASIYDILKDPEKRKIYDRVLVEGIPDWRSPIFYYRRVRKIGLAEGLAYLYVIVTVFQYCIYWAHYWEKKFTLREAVNAKKKSVKKKKSAEEMEALLAEQEMEILGPRPTFWDLLPCQTARLAKYLALAIPRLPWTLHGLYREMKAKQAEEERLRREEEAELERREEERKERKERKKERKRVNNYEERTGGSASDDHEERPLKKEDIFKQPANANQIWTDVELAKLAKLIRKYPQGTLDRWERIAEILERLPWEVTKMAKKIKDNAYMVPVAQMSQGITGFEAKNSQISDDLMEATVVTDDDDDDESEDDENSDSDFGAYSLATKADFVPVEVKTKVKTRKEEDEDSNSLDVWSQAQQKAFEMALVQFPKGATERWERIANKVPGKTKEQCIARFKSLAEMVKKKRETAS